LEHDFAVILLDVQMPDLDGFETAALVRQRESSKNTPIIFLTAEQTAPTQQFRGYAVGAVDYMLKPIEPEILRSKVSVFVELHRKNLMLERQSDLLRRSEQRGAELAETRAKLLADLEASIILATSLDYQTTLERVARLAVPRLADWCVIDVVDESGQLRRMAAAHVDPAKEPLLRELREHFRLDPRSQKPAARALRTGQPELLSETTEIAPEELFLDPEQTELVRKLGSHSSMAVPLIARGRTVGVISLGSGVRGRDYAPSDLALAEEYARRAALAIDNARLYQQAQEAIRARDDFLSIAAHELRTPITTLELQLESMIRGLEKSEESRQTERLAGKVKMAVRQTVRLARLTDNLLDVSRITGGRLELQIEEFDLAQVVRDVVERFNVEAIGAGCVISISAPESVMGEWDHLRMEQIVTNLLTNALKYGAGKPVEISIFSDPENATIVVKDHGIGIGSEDLERIFGRFERAVPTTHYGGLGLGLFITRQMVDAHGGSIGAISRPGEGSTFTVTVPFKHRAGKHEEPSSNSRGAA
jgi:signal transduction histidine kinase